MIPNAYTASEQEYDGIDALEKARHSASHVLAMAVLEIFPEAKLGIGPATEDGFYYDFDIPQKITKEDLDKIETRMLEIKSKEIPFVQEWMDKDEAIDMLNIRAQLYKVELLSELSDDKISFYKTGDDFMDLCRGPHVEHTGLIGFFKLVEVSGAYWKSDETRPQLQRIKGICFLSEDELENHFKKQEEIKMSDHRKIGEDLLLFSQSSIDQGFINIFPKGEFILTKIENELYDTVVNHGFMPVRTPEVISENEITNKNKSKNYEIKSIDGEQLFYRTASYQTHFKLVNNLVKSENDLPLRTFEIGRVLRYEKSGELAGLYKTRSFTMLGAFDLFTEGSFNNEFGNYIQLMKKVFSMFCFKNTYLKIKYFDQAKKDDELKIDLYEKIIESMHEILEVQKIKFFETIEEANEFKIILEFVITDSFNRETVISSSNIKIVDFVDELVKSDEHYFITIEAAIIGSLERLMSIIIEETSGNLPMWLSPLQIVVIPIASRFNMYAEEIRDLVIKNGYRAVCDDRDEKMQSKVRDAQLQKVPYMIIIGEKEDQMKTASLRNRKGIDLGMMSKDELLEKLKKDLEERS